MAKTLISYPGNGSRTDFSFEFDYLNRDYVKVFVDGVPVTFTLPTPYSARIVPAPAPGTIATVQRITPTDHLVDFVNGSILLADDLNVATLQALHVAAEAADVAELALNPDLDGSFDAGNRRIKNLANPVGAKDAVTKGWLDAYNTAYIAEMESLLAAAGTKASNADLSADDAADYADEASDYARSANADRIQTGADRSAVAADRQDVATLRQEVAADRQTIGLDRAATGFDRENTALDRAAVAADRVQTGADRTATEADRVQTALDRAATEAAAAVASALELPSLAGQAGKFLRVKTAETGVEYKKALTLSEASDGSEVNLTVAGRALLAASSPAEQRDLLSAAPLASPAFAGNPTAPTPALSEDSTRLATTAFVKSAVADFSAGGTSKIAPQALSDGNYLGQLQALNTTSPQGFTGLAGIKRLRLDLCATTYSVNGPELSLSADDGVTWTSFSRLISGLATSFWVGTAVVDLETGAWSYTAVSVGGAFMTTTGTNAGGPFNAVRLRNGDNRADVRFSAFVWALSGVTSP